MMSMTSIGDLARNFVLTRKNAQIKSNATTLVEELASGRVKNLSRHLGGDFSHLSGVTHAQNLNAAYAQSAKEAGLISEAMQLALGKIETEIEGSRSELLTIAAAPSKHSVSQLASTARDSLSTIVAALNGTAAGRSLFAGASTGGQALASADSLLDNLHAELSGVTSPDEFNTRIDAWFAEGGGYDTAGYMGSQNGMGSMRIGANETLDLTVKADDQRLRSVLSSMAKLSLLPEISVSIPPEMSPSLLTGLAESVSGSLLDLTTLRSEVGFAEERIAERQSSLASEATALEYAYGRIVSIDPYEHATQLQEAEVQLESLYTLTARLSRLSLMDYLR